MLKNLVKPSREGASSRESRSKASREFRRTGYVLLNLMPDPAITIDLKGKIVEANKIVAQRIGVRKEELLEDSLLDASFLTKNGKQMIKENISKMIKGLHVAPFELEILRKDGKTIWVEVNGTRPEYKRKPAVVLVLRDITERKNLEKNLKENEEKYRTLVEQSLQGIVIAQGPPLRLVFANSAMAKISGYTRDELISLSPTELEGLIHPEDRAMFFNRFRDRIMGKPAPPHYEFRGIRKDGEVRWLEIASNKIEYDGQPAVQAAFVDVSERKQTEEITKAEQKRILSILEELPACLCLVASDYSVRFANRYFQERFGDPKDGHCYELLHKGKEPCRECKTFLVFETGKHQEWELTRVDGRVYRIYDYPFTDVDGSPLILEFGVDITERKQMEQRLREAERLAGIGEAAAMIGHDLRNPLQAMVNRLHLAKKALENVSQPYSDLAAKLSLKELFSELTERTVYMNKIVSDLQDYARPIKPELVETSLYQLLYDALSVILVPENVIVVTTIKRDFPKLMIDPNLMRRVFTNLILNAIQAMPSGGQLTVRASETDNEVLICFQDAGVGIPKENIDKLFIPLYTTKARGAGLGLPVCKRLVEAHGGSITVESKTGEGSTFTVRLPQKERPVSC